MFDLFRSKKDKPVAPESKQESQLPRGLEVIMDDPETSWGLWDEASASQELRARGASSAAPARPAPSATAAAHVPMPAVTGFPNEDYAETRPMEFEEKTPIQLAEEALRTIDLHHARVAKTIRLMWGYRECSPYIAKLPMTGYDETGSARLGFHHEAVTVMMTLGDLHDRIFGFGSNSKYGDFDGHSASDHEMRHRK